MSWFEDIFGKKSISAPAWNNYGATASSGPRYGMGDWQQYNPNTAQANYNPDAMSRLSDIIRHGGYSPEQKQTMLGGAMAPVYEQAREAGQRAEGDAYSRGLGQSGVLSRSYGDIERGVSGSMATIAGQIEQQGAAQVMPAIQNMMQGEQFNASLRQEKENLAAQLNMHSGDLQVALNKINSAMDMSDADRAVTLAQMQNQYNLDASQMEMLQNEAKKDRWSSFWANLMGSGAMVAGAAVGQPAAAT